MKKKKTAAPSAKRGQGPPRLPVIIVAFCWFFLSAFVYVWCSVKVVQYGYRLSRAHRLHSELLNANKKLLLELARLKAPERIERIATQQLGLRHPDKDQVVVLP